MLDAARRRPVLYDRILAPAMITTAAQTGSRINDISNMQYDLMAVTTVTVHKTNFGDMELLSFRTDQDQTNQGE
jgi:hypothetical protein